MSCKLNSKFVLTLVAICGVLFVAGYVGNSTNRSSKKVLMPKAPDRWWINLTIGSEMLTWAGSRRVELWPTGHIQLSERKRNTTTFSVVYKGMVSSNTAHNVYLQTLNILENFRFPETDQVEGYDIGNMELTLIANGRAMKVEYVSTPISSTNMVNVKAIIDLLKKELPPEHQNW